MKRIIALLALLFMLPAHAEEAAASLSAGAVVSMHNAVMRDELGLDYEITLVVGEDALYRLYTDDARRGMFMVGFGEEDAARAETVVLQSYSQADFEEITVNSLRAVCLPFMTDEEYADFEIWLAGETEAVKSALSEGADCEYNYFTGAYVSCAVSLYHDEGKLIFTAVAAWEHPLSAEEITLLMSGGETEE